MYQSRYSNNDSKNGVNQSTRYATAWPKFWIVSWQLLKKRLFGLSSGKIYKIPIDGNFCFLVLLKCVPEMFVYWFWLLYFCKGHLVINWFIYKYPSLKYFFSYCQEKRGNPLWQSYRYRRTSFSSGYITHRGQQNYMRRRYN